MSLDSKNTNILCSAASKLAVCLTTIGTLTMNSVGAVAGDVSAKVSNSSQQSIAMVAEKRRNVLTVLYPQAAVVDKVARSDNAGETSGDKKRYVSPKHTDKNVIPSLGRAVQAKGFDIIVLSVDNPNEATQLGLDLHKITQEMNEKMGFNFRLISQLYPDPRYTYDTRGTIKLIKSDPDDAARSPIVIDEGVDYDLDKLIPITDLESFASAVEIAYTADGRYDKDNVDIRNLPSFIEATENRQSNLQRQ